MAPRGEMRSAPRGDTLGKFADMLARIKRTGNYAQVPLLDMGVGDLIIGEADKYIDDLSYGMKGYRGKGQTAQLPAGAADTALLPGMGLLAGIPARALLRRGGKGIKDLVGKQLDIPHSPSRRNIIKKTGKGAAAAAALTLAPKGLIEVLAKGATKTLPRVAGIAATSKMGTLSTLMDMYPSLRHLFKAGDPKEIIDEMNKMAKKMERDPEAYLREENRMHFSSVDEDKIPMPSHPTVIDYMDDLPVGLEFGDMPLEELAELKRIALNPENLSQTFQKLPDEMITANYEDAGEFIVDAMDSGAVNFSNWKPFWIDYLEKNTGKLPAYLEKGIRDEINDLEIVSEQFNEDAYISLSRGGEFNVNALTERYGPKRYEPPTLDPAQGTPETPESCSAHGTLRRLHHSTRQKHSAW